MKEQNVEQLRETLLADDQVRSTISARAYEIYKDRAAVSTAGIWMTGFRRRMKCWQS